MDKNNFVHQEGLCSALFCEATPCWHVFTPENYPILFTCKADFQKAMAVVGICALLFPEIRIYTFIVMNNHLHFVMGGQFDRIEMFFEELKRSLSYAFENLDLSGWLCKIKPIEDHKYFRMAVAYCHRNAYVVEPQYTPSNYPWGAGQLYFADDLKELHRSNMKKMSGRERREIIHGKRADGIEGPSVVNGCVSPLSFCYVDMAEKIFRDARHYFGCLSKDVESLKAIASECSEDIFYTDNELYSIVTKECARRYNEKKISDLSAEEKIDIALMMRHDYNSSNKQICRILHIDAAIVNRIFPLRGYF